MNKKTFFNWTRWLHVYSSTALFSLLIFFCVSGITLNHPDWASSSSSPTLIEGKLPESVWQSIKPPVSETLMGWLEHRFSLTSAASIEWDPDTQEIMLDFPHPGGFAFVIINHEEGMYTIDYQKGNIWQVINDLHKGRHSGKAWSWLIDLSAGFMVFFSITGLIILWQHRAKRKPGLMLTLLGTATPLLFFLLFVPHISGV